MPPRKKSKKNTSKTGDDTYSQESYWSKRYAVGDGAGEDKVEERDHDWYFSGEELQPLLDPLIDSIIDSESPNTILEIGCGMKPILTCLNFDLDSTLNLISLDYSPPCITYLQSSFKSKKSKKYTFEVADAKNLKYEDNSIPIVIEKGTLDAIITSGVSNAVKVLSEMSRVTSRYLLVVTHFNLETEEGQEWMEDVLEPSLNVEDDGVFWKVNCNVGEGGGAMVIICEKCVRRETRNKGGERMQIEVTEY